MCVLCAGASDTHLASRLRRVRAACAGSASPLSGMPITNDLDLFQASVARREGPCVLTRKLSGGVCRCRAGVNREWEQCRIKKAGCRLAMRCVWSGGCVCSGGCLIKAAAHVVRALLLPCPRSHRMATLCAYLHAACLQVTQQALVLDRGTPHHLHPTFHHPSLGTWFVCDDQAHTSQSLGARLVWSAWSLTRAASSWCVCAEMTAVSRHGCWPGGWCSKGGRFPERACAHRVQSLQAVAFRLCCMALPLLGCIVLEPPRLEHRHCLQRNCRLQRNC